MKLQVKFFEELTTRELYEIVRSRTEIFLLEQHIICQDFDGVDYDALHCFLEENGKILAYLRAYPAGEGAAKVFRIQCLYLVVSQMPRRPSLRDANVSGTFLPFPYPWFSSVQSFSHI